MASKQPTVRQISLFAMLIQIIILYLFIFIYNVLDIGDPLVLAIVTYLVLQLILRYTVTLNHRRGVSYFKNNKYKEAIKEFEKSYDYFDKHRWIDKYKPVTLLSSSRMSYLEMALINMAYCYSQIGAGGKAKALYEKALKEFPDSQMAISALKIYDSAKDIDQ